MLWFIAANLLMAGSIPFLPERYRQSPRVVATIMTLTILNVAGVNLYLLAKLNP